MRKFKSINDFSAFNPIVDDKTISFTIEDFEKVIIAIEGDVIFDINEGKKTFSGQFVEKVSEYLNDDAELKEVIDALEVLKKDKESA